MVRPSASAPCCTRIRPMLSVAPVTMVVPYPAPPPGRQAPAWITASAPLLQDHGLADLHTIVGSVVADGYARLRSGRMTLTSGAWIEAMRLQHQIEAAADPGADETRFFVVELLDEIRRWLGPEQFGEFRAGVEQRYAAGRDARRRAR